MVQSSTNKDDMELLRKNPAELLVRYRRKIERLVLHVILPARSEPDMFNDIVQEVNETLLRKLPTIQQQYNGSALVRTYLLAIARNICLKIGKRLQHERETQGTALEVPYSPPQIDDRYSIEHECFRLRGILLTFGRKRPKLVICLKLDFRIPLHETDLDGWHHSGSRKNMHALLELFGGDYETMRDADVFEAFAPFWNEVEGKNNTPDSIRKWANEKLNQIIELLNGIPQRHSYDKITVRTLFEYYVAWERQEKR